MAQAIVSNSEDKLISYDSNCFHMLSFCVFLSFYLFIYLCEKAFLEIISFWKELTQSIIMHERMAHIRMWM